jgi:hypothetical protein
MEVAAVASFVAWLGSIRTWLAITAAAVQAAFTIPQYAL